jgi:hypothetical protein
MDGSARITIATNEKTRSGRFNCGFSQNRSKARALPEGNLRAYCKAVIVGGEFLLIPPGVAA